MSWKDIVNKADCRVTVCYASKCKHNKGFKCSLSEVTISDNGSCLMYTQNPLSPALPKLTGGQQSFIDRATRNLNEEKRNR
tara:strand:+ start:393 stop:635 length:243 start_codon:yes stop_codon:yes gene_type:complete